MPLQKLPTTGLDDINHRRRARETLNNVLDHSFDDSRVQTTAEKLAGVTPVNYAYAPGDFRRYGALDDGVTDNTTVMLTAANAIGGRFYIALNVLYDRAAFIAGVDPDVYAVDESVINNYTSAGETAKRVGVIGGSEPQNDLGFSIDGGYHPFLVTNNFGTNTTPGGSGVKGYASWFWARGQHETNGLAKRGDRYVARCQFGSYDATYLSWTIFVNAPWLVADGLYEYWQPGEVIAGAGVYRSSAVGHYISTGAGTTGATEPTHTTGTVSDGGVSWTFVAFIDIGIYAIDERNRVRFGDPTADFQFGFRTGHYDTAGNCAIVFECRGASKITSLRLVPTNSAGGLINAPYIDAQDVGGGAGAWRFWNPAGTAEMFRLTDAELFAFKSSFAHSMVTITYSASMTPDASAANSQFIDVTNGTAMTINAPSNPLTGRRLKLRIRNTSGGAMGVITWNATYKMSAWTNPATGFSRSIEFEYDGAAWIETSRTPADVPN